MKKSVDIINPASTSKNGKTVVIYDRAFRNPNWSLSNVITHEFGHAFFLNLNAADQRTYAASRGWIASKGRIIAHPDAFVSSRATDSIDEDFAESFGFFLLSKETLKSKAPKAYTWLLKKFKGNLKL